MQNSTLKYKKIKIPFEKIKTRLAYGISPIFLEIRQSQIKVGEKDQILEQEDQIEKNDAIFIPSFLTKSIQLVDNQNNLEQQNENLITEIQNTCQDEVIEFEANKVYEINHEKRGDQKQIQIPDSPLIQNFSVEIQNFNSQPTNAHKKSEIIKDSLFLESIQPGVQIKNELIKIDSKQIQIKDPVILKAIQDYHIKKTKIIQNKSILKNVHSKIFKLRCFKQSEYQQFLGLDPNDKQIIEKHVNESLDILQIYKDLILLKKAIMILVSKEQLAALQLIGISSEYMKSQNNLQQNSQLKNENKYKKMSYLEEQYCILKQNDLKEQYIKSYFEKMQQGQTITEVDQRILNSLL
ncbi:hypothetical protein ABPG74_003836 [Tetrahymena malaccensis]